MWMARRSSACGWPGGRLHADGHTGPSADGHTGSSTDGPTGSSTDGPHRVVHGWPWRRGCLTFSRAVLAIQLGRRREMDGIRS